MAFEDVQDDELEALARRARQRFMQNSFEQESPESNLGLQLAAGGLDLLSKNAQDSQDIMSISTGIKGPNMRGGSAAEALQKQLAAKSTSKRQKALDDMNSMSAIQKLVDARKERDQSELQRRQTMAMGGFSLGEDGMPVIVPGGSADTERRFKEAQMKKLEADAKRPGGANGYGSDKDLRNLEIKLRGEYEGRDVTKETQKVATAYQKVSAAAKNPSAAGDLSLIFGYMKMLDPGSTVREGEFANAQNAAGIPDQVRNMYNRASSGERLNPAQRVDFIGQAKNIFEAQLNTQKQIDDRYNLLASQYGVNPKNVVSSYDFSIPDTVSTKSAAPAQGSGALTPEELAEKEALKKELGL